MLLNSYLSIHMHVDAFQNWKFAITLWKSSEIEMRSSLLTVRSTAELSIFIWISDDRISTLFNYYPLKFLFPFCQSVNSFRVGIQLAGPPKWKRYRAHEINGWMFRLHVARHLWPEFLTNCNLYIYYMCGFSAHTQNRRIAILFPHLPSNCRTQNFQFICNILSS